jgi:hypothetical protein
MTYNTKPFENYQFVSIQMQSAQGRYYFPDLPNLREVYTTGIIFYPPNISPNDVNNFTATGGYINSYITLNCNGEEFIQKLGLINLITISQNNKQNLFGLTTLPNVKIQYQKSYIEPAYGLSSPISFPSCFQFGVYYSKNPR